MKKFKKSETLRTHSGQAGFTLIEILVVIGIIAILAAVVIIAINPARQFAQARDSQRSSNVNAILNGVWQRMVDNRGVWDPTCGALTVNLPAAPAVEIGTDVGLIDLEACIVPTYLPSMVADPTAVDASLNTEYTIVVDAGGRITVDAPNAEINIPISVTR
jgi:prepilin-type N-terminal cleavage/methylation domain-containing protein